MNAQVNQLIDSMVNGEVLDKNLDEMGNMLAHYGMIRDFYEDNLDDSRANFYAWMIENKFKAYKPEDSVNFSWFNKDTISAGLGNPESDIPGKVWEKLAKGEKVANHRKYATLQEALEDLHEAFKSEN